MEIVFVCENLSASLSETLIVRVAIISKVLINTPPLYSHFKKHQNDFTLLFLPRPLGEDWGEGFRSGVI